MNTHQLNPDTVFSSKLNEKMLSKNEMFQNLNMDHISKFKNNMRHDDYVHC